MSKITKTKVIITTGTSSGSNFIIGPYSTPPIRTHTPRNLNNSSKKSRIPPK